MSKKQSYQDIDHLLTGQQLPDEEMAWADMQQRLDKDTRRRRFPLSPFLQGCGFWLLTGILLLAVGIWYWQNEENTNKEPVSSSVIDQRFFIERKTTLTATEEQVIFKDVKDGFFAIRVARELEMPSTQEDVFTDSQGNKTTVGKMINNEGVTGNYISSEGIEGDDVWGTKGRWTMLTGKKDGQEITIGMMDHPSNMGYPSYWHARGYGLFAINPLGRKVFSNGKEQLNLTLGPREAVTFRYKVVISSGEKLVKEEMDSLADDFAR